MEETARRNRILLISGFVLLAYAILCPLFLTDRTLGIYRTFRQALAQGRISLVYLTVLKLVFLNCMRSIPIYLSAFLIAESVVLPRQVPFPDKLRHLIPLLIIPPVYFLVFPLYGIRYDFGMPALILVCYVLSLSFLNLFSVSLPQKIITLATPFLGMQFLDVTPGLTGYGFGRGEISQDIKSMAAVMGCEPELSFYSLSLFAALVLCSAIHLRLLVQEHRIRITTAKNQKMEKELYQARLEALHMRSASEAQSLVHDLKTPLTTIQGLVGLAEMMEENSLIQDYLSRISRASESMRVMISDILHEEHLSPVPVARLLKNILSNASVFLPETLLTVEDRCPPGTLVQVNRIRMVRAVVNLLENAWKAVDPRDGRITLALEERDGQVWIQVADNGTGMSQEQCLHVFDLGWSGTGSTGLGLGYVKRVVDYHGGTISLESAPGQGTSITVTLKEAEENGG